MLFSNHKIIISKIKFTDDACLKLVKVPRVFLKIVLQGCVNYAKESNITLINGATMDKINDKRNQEKKR